MTTTNTTARCLPAYAGLLFVLLSYFGSSLANTFEQKTMQFDRISVADGLAQSAVMAVVQDQSGFLWFATERGLDRYDGFTFKHYRHERGNPNSLASDFVRDLDLADDGSLWIATLGGGVSHWDPTTDSITTYRMDANNPRTLADDRIRAILAGNDGFVWIGTRDSGLDRLNIATREVSHFVHDPDDAGSLSSNKIYSLAMDADGSIWIGTAAGLNRLDIASGEITRFSVGLDKTGSSKQSAARTLLFGHDGTLWLGINNVGLVAFDTESQTARYFGHDSEVPGNLSSARIDALFEDDQRRLWVGTDNGLNLLDSDSGEFIVYKNNPADPASISGNSIFSIFQDRAGLLWIGTRTGGLSKWNPRSWSFGHIKPETSGPHSFSSSNITAFTEDYEGNTWVGTFGGGINVIDHSGHSVTQIRRDRRDGNSIDDDRVMALITDRRGKIWAGTMRGGLSKIDAVTGEIRNYRNDPSDPKSLAADGVMSILQDSSGYIWAGTFGGGVSRLDPDNDQFTNYGHDPNDSTSLSSPRATTIVEGRDGVIWVGTDGGGLNYLDNGSGDWHHLKHDLDDVKSLSADTIYSLHVDARGTLWVGTRQGLDRVSVSQSSNNGTKVVDISTVEGLNQTAVYGVQSDSLGNLWISSAQGLARYNPTTGEIRNFHKSQGLQGEEFTAGADYRSPDGKLYFGGANGFNVFDPAEVELNTQAPPVVLTSLSIINEPVTTGRPYEHIQGLDLDYQDHVVTFGISALDFTAPKENRYAYMLEGFDDTWVDAGNERRITYTNLDGGQYVLKVRAANSDGVWNEKGIEIPINVAFAPWRTWWAYTLYVGVFLAAIFALWRQQERKLQREFEYSRRLEKEVEGRTRELNNRNRDLKVANRKLQDASTTDALTGLRNRRHLFQQVDKDVDLVLRHYRDGTETMRPDGNNDLLFLMVDLDNFKPVNDSCGHEAGDRLLLQVRDVLLEACRKTDDVIRWGGDEFLIVARETNRKYAATLAERVRDSLSGRVFPVGDGQVARVTSSIGYASYPFLKEKPDLLSWEEVLGVADAAMYEAKQKRNAWTGIEGLEWEGTGDELYRAIKSEPGVLAEEGAIRAIESVEDAAEGIA
jgi:diguanylate cyclase (GGDEF)-like protein